MHCPDSDKLFSTKKPFEWSAVADEWFMNACRENALYLSKNSPEIALLYRKHGFNPETLLSRADLEKLPAIWNSALARFEIPVGSDEPVLVDLSRRDPSERVYWSRGAWGRYSGAIVTMAEQLDYTSDRPANYLFLSWNRELEGAQPEVMKQLRRLCPGLELRFQHDPIECAHTLRDFTRIARPIRLVGTAHSFRALLSALRAHEPMELPKHSMAILLHTDSATLAEREALRAETMERFCLPKSRVRQILSIYPTGGLLAECSDGQLHLPNYLRPLIRSPQTFDVLPDGESGVVQWVFPLNPERSALAIQTSDFGTIDVTTKRCACKLTAPVFSPANP